MKSTIKVLIVDDSALVRHTLQHILNSDPEIEVIATAEDPYVAAKKINEQVPDVITLDIQMPKMDGLTFLQKLMKQYPIPVIMISTYTEKWSETSLKALKFGAVDIINKPKIDTKRHLEESRILIIDMVKAAYHAKLEEPAIQKPITKVVTQTDQDEEKEPIEMADSERIVLMGASTGGTEAIELILKSLPANFPPMIIVQHMPEKFTEVFAKRLNKICDLEVREAQNGDRVEKGQVLIAPGNFHTLINKNGPSYVVSVKDGPLINRRRPSVDILFRSAARNIGASAIGILLTGMGNDGAKGMLEMKQAGAKTIAQDEESCVVFGMPKEAINIGAVDSVVPLSDMPKTLLTLLKN